MELKQGYKNTEIGVIPEDWEVRKLGEIGDVKMCRRIFSFQTTKFGEVPFFKIGTFGNEPDAFISRQLFEDYKNKFSFPKKSDILISASGTIGRTVVYKGEDEYFQDSNIIWIENNERILLNKLLNYIFKTINFDTEGNTIKRLYNSNIKNTSFILPPLPEQQKIAEVLNDTDALIQSLKKLIQKKKNLKQGAMQELLTPKEDWEVKRLGEIGKTIGGLRGKTKSDFDNGNGKYITFLNVMNNVVIDATILEKVFIKSGEKQNTFLYGDLFFNTSSETPEEVGMCAILLENIDNLYLNSFCFGYRLNNDFELDGLFLSYIINSSIGRKIFESLAQGATRYNLSKTNFNNVELYVPKSKSEQTRIAQILSDMDVEIALLEKQLQKTENLKQGMMQELLTGKIRLVAAQTKNIMSKFKTT